METVTTAARDLPDSVDKFEEYKFFAESTQFLTERRQAIGQIYMGITTGIITVLGFFLKDGLIVGIMRTDRGRGWAYLAANVLMVVVGLLVCRAWKDAVRYYETLINWRYTQLTDLEEPSVLRGSHQFYTKESRFFRDETAKSVAGPGRSPRSLGSASRLEARLPFLLGVLYVAYLVGLIFAAFASPSR